MRSTSKPADAGTSVTQLQLQSPRSEAALTSANFTSSESTQERVRPSGRLTFDTGLTAILVEEVSDAGSRS